MIIRLLATQIPKFWDVIKFVIVKIYTIAEEDITVVLNKALAELLADNYQCFLKLNDDGSSVEAVVITHILLDKFTGQKSLSLECLYSFKLQSEWTTFFNFVKDYGRSQGCVDKTGNVIVYGYSGNPRAQDLMDQLGFKELLRTYRYIGG
jgi:hypothetical protein